MVVVGEVVKMRAALDWLGAASEGRVLRPDPLGRPEEVARAFQGNPQHPVTRALLGPLEQFNLPSEYFLEIMHTAGKRGSCDRYRSAAVIVKNKRIGVYDGAYRCVSLATGRGWERRADGTVQSGD